MPLWVGSILFTTPYCPISGSFPVGMRKRSICFKVSSRIENHGSRVKYDSLRVLEWEKLCDSVSSFACTSFGRQAIKAQLWSLNRTFEESVRLLEETNAAILMHNHGTFNLDLTSVDLVQVKSAIQHAQRGSPLDPNEAMAVLSLLQFVEALQLNLKSAIKEDMDWNKLFMPLSNLVMQLVVNRSLVKLIQQVIDEDGSVKDSASPALKKSRYQVQRVERKLYQLLDSLIRNEMKEGAVPEINNIDGRWCIRSGADKMMSFRGLLISSGSGIGNIVEPLAAVPLNDELQQARLLVAKAEADVLLTLTEKMQMDLDDIEKILISLIELDMINARATYSLSFGGTSPSIFLPEDKERSQLRSKSLDDSNHKREWMVYLPNAYHPLLLQQHKESLLKARKDVSHGNAVSTVEQAPPVPIDFLITQKTKVLVITGPNTGGKTICLKTVGLAAMMAKSGLHVLSSESAQIPWFDSVFADIGDDQSLSQSLSTFSGHLKQIKEIQAQSTHQSLVLLDEVGAGTNPLEGAALGMSLLESFAESGALLTLATTHHGELKALKYSNDSFENASMEFDEVKLKPTYKVLWGVPGRSSAINIAERLGVPSIIVDNASEIYGAASAKIDQVIMEMENFKQKFQGLMLEAGHYLMLSRGLYDDLLLLRTKVVDHGAHHGYWKMREVSQAAAIARSLLHKEVHQFRASVTKHFQPIKTIQQTISSNNKDATEVKTEHPMIKKMTELPRVGDVVHVSSLGKNATVLRVEPSKEEIIVQAGNMKLKLKLSDIRN